MTDEKWEELVERIKKMAKIIRHETLPKFKEISSSEGMQKVKDGTIEELEFEGPLGKMKLAHWVRPKVEEVKIWSHRKVEGATLQVRRSETETVATENLYKWDNANEEWKEVDLKTLIK